MNSNLNMGYRRGNKLEPHFLEIHSEYNLIYQQLLKEARFWNSSGQYWLALESTNKAKQLLNGDIGLSLKATPTEIYYYNENSMTIGNHVR